MTTTAPTPTTMSKTPAKLSRRAVTPRRRSTRSRLLRGLGLAVLTAWTLGSLFPFYFTVATSLKEKRQLFKPTALLFTPTLDNYRQLFTVNNFGHYLANSTLVVSLSILPSLVLAIFCAYGLTRCGLKKERTLALTLLSLRMVPAIAVVIPFFLMAQAIRLIDTPWVLIVAYTTFNLPLGVWMLRGFFRDIPEEIDEAAQIDGAGRLRILWTMTVPIAMPGIVTTAILMLIASWNEFVFANFLTTSGARTFPTTVGLFLSISGTDFGQMAASAVLGTLPILTFAFITQKRLTHGLSYGAV